MITIKSIFQSLKAKESAIKKERANLSKIVGQTAVVFFTRSFRRQGWQDGSFQRWEPRKGEKPRSGNTKKTDKESRGILIGSGRTKRGTTGQRLSRSITIVQMSTKRIIISTPKIYAEIHNSGGVGSNGRVRFNMPKRQFMGKSKDLDRQTIGIIKKRINFIMKTTYK